MRIPVIGLTCYTDRDKYYLYHEYCEAIVDAGGIPFIIPYIDDTDKLKAVINIIDGVLFAGGGDIHPSYYGGKVTCNLKRVNKERDEFEFKLLELVLKSGKPILGICRGCQLFNVFFGGTLYEHIDGHYKKAPYKKPTHKIIIKENTLLFKLVGKKEIKVNSFHHQAIKKLGNGLIASSQGEDGIIESIEKPDYPFLLGVQFHPEYIYRIEDIYKIFKGFLDATNEKKGD